MNGGLLEGEPRFLEMASRTTESGRVVHLYKCVGRKKKRVVKKTLMRFFLFLKRVNQVARMSDLAGSALECAKQLGMAEEIVQRAHDLIPLLKVGQKIVHSSFKGRVSAISEMETKIERFMQLDLDCKSARHFLEFL